MFGALATAQHLQGLDADTFSDRFAWFWGEVTTIHPFRDVNTRSQYMFFDQLARHAGWVIDWARVPGDVMAHARTLAIASDHTGIDALIRPNLHTITDVTRMDELRDRMAEHARRFQTPRPSRDPAALARELDAARERRRRLPPSSAFGRQQSGPDRGGPTLGR